MKNKTLIISVCTLILTFSFCDAYAAKTQIYCNAACGKQIQSLLDTYRQAAKIPGIQLTVSFPDQPMQTFCSGTISRDGKIPINKKTRFEIGSTTKSFSAAIALQLAAEGKFSLNDKVGKWFGKEYPAWQDNTIHDLLNMTSTLLDYFDGDNGKFQAVYEKDPTHIWTTKELTDWVYQGGPNCTRTNKLTSFCAETPGKGWSYSNTNYILLERIMEKTAKQPLRTLMYARILKPLQMNSALYEPLQNPAEIKNFAHAYNNDPKSSAYGKDVTNFSLSPARAAGAIIATSEDLAKWVRGLFNGKVLPPEQMKIMTSTVCTADSKDCKAGETLPTNSAQTSYSCGLMKFIDQNTKRVYWLHTGGSEGQASVFIYDPQTKLTITILQNMTPTSPNQVELATKVMKYLNTK